MTDDDTTIFGKPALPTHDETQTVLLHAIERHLNRLIPGATFELLVVVNAAGSALRVTGTDSPGVVRCIHNPTNAAITLTLFDGMPGNSTPALFSTNLAAGESRPVFLPFSVALFATQGSGARVYGEYRR
jgi:hypothetical protein